MGPFKFESKTVKLKQNKRYANAYLFFMCLKQEVEPALTYVNSDLNAARLPIPPLRQPLEHLSYQKVGKIESQII